MFPIWKLPQLVTRPWRLCRELDDYDDAECAAFARNTASSRMIGLLLAVPIVMVVGIGLAIASGSVMPNVSPAEATPMERGVSAVVIVTVFVFTLGVALLPYLMIVRWTLKRQISRVVCPSCQYSLLGLTVEAGATTCPECGEHVRLADHGLRPEDILSGARKRVRNDLDPAAKRSMRALNIAFVVWVAAWLVVWVATGRGGLEVAGFGVIAWIVAHAYRRHGMTVASPDEK